MTFRSKSSGALFLAIVAFAQGAWGLCEESSKVSSNTEDAFFVNCQNTFSGPKYTVTQYIGPSKKNGYVSFRDEDHGFSCSETDRETDCVTLPRGAFQLRKFEVSRGIAVELVELKEAGRFFAVESATFRYPRRSQTAMSLGCFVVVKDDNHFIFGIDKARLPVFGNCLVAFERYVSKNRALVLKSLN